MYMCRRAKYFLIISDAILIASLFLMELYFRHMYSLKLLLLF